MSGYAAFARFYDSLTGNVDYPARAAYFSGLIRRHAGRQVATVLDLACGTASLLLELGRLGYDMIGADASSEMLSVAASKISELSAPPLLLCQAMERLDLFDTVDACVCALDSLNHLSGERALMSAFGRVSLFLNPGGIFVFDVNSLHKHRSVLSDNTFVYETPQVLCVWRNRFREASGDVDIALDFFEREGGGNRYLRQSEHFRESYFSREALLRALESSGLEFIAEYAGDSLDPPRDTTQRIVMVARK